MKLRICYTFILTTLLQLSMTAQSILFTNVNIFDGTTERLITVQDVLYPKPTGVPENFIDTLKKYDWVNLFDYGYHVGQPHYYGEPFKIHYNYDFFRVEPDGKCYDFEGGKDYPDYPYHVTYKDRGDWAIHTKSIVKKIGMDWMRIVSNKGKVSYQRILSYEDGLLIYDVTRGGSIYETDSPSRFRIVAMAVPRAFDYQF